MEKALKEDPTAGPIPLTIEQYWARQEKTFNKPSTTTSVEAEKPRRTRRGGRKNRLRRMRAALLQQAESANNQRVKSENWKAILEIEAALKIKK